MTDDPLGILSDQQDDPLGILSESSPAAGIGKPADTSLSSEASKGLKAGLQNIKGFGYGLGALAGEVTGIESLKQASVEGLKDVEQTIQEKYAPAVGSYKDVGGLNDALKYVTYGVATNLPNLLLSLASGGVGALVGKGIAKGAAEEIVKKYAMRGAMAGAGMSSVGMETGSIAGD
jgi:hypothetical protein